MFQKYKNPSKSIKKMKPPKKSPTPQSYLYTSRFWCHHIQSFNKRNGSTQKCCNCNSPGGFCVVMFKLPKPEVGFPKPGSHVISQTKQIPGDHRKFHNGNVVWRFCRQLAHLKKFTELFLSFQSRRCLDSHLAGVIRLELTQTNGALFQNTSQV